MMRTLVVAMLAFIVGCSNPNTEAGSEGYITKGAWFGQQHFYGVQVGPASPGLGWLLSVINLDMRWWTATEEFEVMSADNLMLKFHAHAVMRGKPGSVREIVEAYGAAAWYGRTIMQPFRNAVYEGVAGYKALDAKDRREAIAGTVREKLLAFIAGKPFEVQAVVIGTITLPDAVAKAQEAKIGKETELERKGFEIKIAQQDAIVRVEEAKGIAEAQKIIQATLTPLYLQHEAIKAQQSMAGAPNHTTVYIPSGTNGIPLVKTIE